MSNLTFSGATDGAMIPTQNESHIMPLSATINALVGTVSTLLTKPTGATWLVLFADKGGFRVRQGDHSATGDNIMPATLVPAASVSDGSVGLACNVGQTLALPAGNKFTIKQYAADSCVTYYWV